MKFKAGNSYELPVKERVVQGNSQYFIVEHDGVEYRIRLYDFQKEQKDPAKLLCLARQVQDGSIALVQDYSAFLNQFYKVGEEYPFTVVSGLKGYELHRARQPRTHFQPCQLRQSQTVALSGHPLPGHQD